MELLSYFLRICPPIWEEYCFLSIFILLFWVISCCLLSHNWPWLSVLDVLLLYYSKHSYEKDMVISIFTDRKKETQGNITTKCWNRDSKPGLPDPRIHIVLSTMSTHLSFLCGEWSKKIFPEFCFLCQL